MFFTSYMKISSFSGALPPFIAHGLYVDHFNVGGHRGLHDGFPQVVCHSTYLDYSLFSTFWTVHSFNLSSITALQILGDPH